MSTPDKIQQKRRAIRRGALMTQEHVQRQENKSVAKKADRLDKIDELIGGHNEAVQTLKKEYAAVRRDLDAELLPSIPEDLREV